MINCLLFLIPLENKNKNFKEFINKEFFKNNKWKIEPSLQNVNPLDKFQFERIGYFCSADDDYTNKPFLIKQLSLRGK